MAASTLVALSKLLPTCISLTAAVDTLATSIVAALLLASALPIDTGTFLFYKFPANTEHIFWVAIPITVYAFVILAVVPACVDIAASDVACIDIAASVIAATVRGTNELWYSYNYGTVAFWCRCILIATTASWSTHLRLPIYTC